MAHDGSSRLNASAAYEASASHEGLLESNKPLPSATTMTSAASKAGALVAGYWATRFPDDQRYAEVAFRSLMFSILDKGTGWTDEAFKRLANNSVKWRKTAGLGGFSPDDPFGQWVDEGKAALSGPDKDHGKEMLASVLVAAVAGLKAGGIKNFFMYYPILSRLIMYICLRWGIKLELNPDFYQKIIGGLEPAEIFFAIRLESIQDSSLPTTCFGFEDVQEVFENPIDPQLMKDCEAQSYSLEAEFVYDTLWWQEHSPCEDVKVPIKNVNGIVTGYNNIGPTGLPCWDEAYTIAPITGTVVRRTIVEAPAVSGYWGSEQVDAMELAIRRKYPPDSHYGDDGNIGERYIHADGTWLTSWNCAWTTEICNNVSDVSSYEAYTYIDHHETSSALMNGFKVGDDCYICKCETGVSQFGSGNWPWQPVPTPFPFGNSSYFGEEEAQRTMTLRHNLLSEDVGTSARWWEDFSIIERTGFALCPLEFSRDRMQSMYHEIKYNPITNYENIGRRAFGFDVPTAGHITGTCGPPQPGFRFYQQSWWLDLLGGPFLAAHVQFENQTLHKRAEITLVPTWPYRWTIPPGGWYYSFRSGGWDMPITTTHVQYGNTEPLLEGGQRLNSGIVPYVVIDSDGITNNWKDGGNPGRERPYQYAPAPAVALEANPEVMIEYFHPSGCYGDATKHTAGVVGCDDVEVTVPHRVFGMGDACQDFPLRVESRKNANYDYKFHTVNLNAYDDQGEALSPFSGNQWIQNYTEDYGVEGLFAGNEELGIDGTTHGIWGKNYWEEYVTGWIYTGSEHAGEIVSCMHEITGYSMDSDKTVRYYHLSRSGTPDYFPWSGKCGLVSHMMLSPYPHLSMCIDLGFFPSGCTGSLGPIFTTTPPTTLDPCAGVSDPDNCDPTNPNAYNYVPPTTPDPYATTTQHPTTTTVTHDPSEEFFGVACHDPPLTLYDCPCDVPATIEGKGQGEENVARCWEECSMAKCDYSSFEGGGLDQHAWDTGIYPHEWGWSAMITKQRTQNPPRYWRGPYASTHFNFIYPKAQIAMDQHYTDVDPEMGITGFPWKVNFDVHIEEYTSRDICSGGYIDSNGDIVWDTINRGESSDKLPTWKKGVSESTLWPNLVDQNYVGSEAVIWQLDEVGECSNTQYTDRETCEANDETWTVDPQSHQQSLQGICDPILSGRTHHTYDQVPHFSWGNKVGTGYFYSYNTPEESEVKMGELEGPHFAWGSFYRHSGYDFKMESTYVMPTFDLKTQKQDYSQMRAALAVGNEITYACGHYLGSSDCAATTTTFDPGSNGGGGGSPGGGGGTTTTQGPQYRKYARGENVLDTLDPVFFLPMDSDTSMTGVYCSGIMNQDGGTVITGQTLHPHEVYGDGWFGLNSGSIFTIAGYGGGFKTPAKCDEGVGKTEGTTTSTTPLPPPSPCAAAFVLEMQEEFEQMSRCDDYADPYFSDFLGLIEGTLSCDRKVWLFGIGPTSIDLSVRQAAYLTGMEVAVNAPYYGQVLGSLNQSSPQLHYKITGTELSVRDAWEAEEDALEKVDPMMAGKNNKGINIFGKDSNELKITFEAMASDGYGVLYEKPSDTEVWFCSGGSTTPTSTTPDYGGGGLIDPLSVCMCDVSGYETIRDLGKRKALEGGGDFMRVSGYREMSKFKITIDNFKVYSHGKMPVDSYYAMQNSGECKLTGYFKYDQQEEASIYTEGIAVADMSDDPYKFDMDYPNYASEVMNRPTIQQPTGSFSHPHPSIPAPSRMQVRVLMPFICPSGGPFSSWYRNLNTSSEHYYNRYVWPTVSDLSHFNGHDLSWEGPPPITDEVFPHTQLLISAAQGQPTPNEAKSEVIDRKYVVTDHWAFYDSIYMDPIINRDWIKPLKVGQVFEPKGGYFVPQGTTVTDIKGGYVYAEKHVPDPDSISDE